VLYGKWSLLVIAGLLVATLIAWPLVTQDRSGLRVSFVDNKTVQAKPSSPVMKNPEYRGTSEKGQQYKVTGKTATQKTPTLIVVEGVEGQLVKPDGSWFSLAADTADYRQDTKVIELMGNVTVVDVEGTTFTTSRATIETQTSHIFGNEAISGVGSMGNIVASGFEIADNGAHITFRGGANPVVVTVAQAKKR
jgi:hypothetical protein